MSDLESAWAALAAEFAVEPERKARGGRAGLGAGSAVDGAEGAEGAKDDVADWLEAEGLSLGRRDGKVFVCCPWKEGHSGDSGETEAAWLVAGTDGYQQGHYLCLHASCQGRLDEEFMDAVGYRAAGFSVVTNGRDKSPDALKLDTNGWEQGVSPIGLKRNKAGAIEATAENLCLAMLAPEWTGYRFRHDAFQGALMMTREIAGENAWRPVTDADNFDFRKRLGQLSFKEPSEGLTRGALIWAGREGQMDTAIEWLDGLPAWDGVLRVASFFDRYFKVEPSPYATAVSLYAWTALAGRVMAPGCQADMIPVLVGEQGAGKSTGLAAMAPTPETFKTIHVGLKDSDLSRKMRGLLVGEMAELGGLSRKAEADGIKAWVTNKIENWTPKYLEYETAFARRCVFFGTTNDESFLGDDTGERRWLPLTMSAGGSVDVAGVARDREQLWAEGLALWRAGGIAWRAAERLAAAEHSHYKSEDSWTEDVARWLDTEEGIAGLRPGDRDLTGSEILGGAFNMNAGKFTKADTMRLGRVMRELGWKKIVAKNGERSVKKWRGPASTDPKDIRS